MSDYFEVLDETDPGSILDGDTLIHTVLLKMTKIKNEGSGKLVDF